MGPRTLLINVLLLGGIVLAASYLTSEWRQFEQDNRLTSLVAGEAAGLPPAGGDLGDREARNQLTAFEPIAERPLFRPERRPLEMAGTEVAAERPAPPNAEMTGSSVFGGQARATLKVSPPRGRGAAQNVNIGVGDAPPQLGGWRVASIVSTAVTLQWNDEQILLDLVPAAAPADQRAAATSGVNIINIGQAAPAVESSSPEAARAEQRGLQIATVAGQNQQSGRGTGARRSTGAAGAGTAGTRTTPTRRPNTANRPNNN